MSLRSENIDLDGMAVVKAFAYTAIVYSIGQDVVSAVQGMAAAPVVEHPPQTWKDFFDGLKSLPALRIGVQFVALVYLGQDFIEMAKPRSLRSRKVEVFRNPLAKGVAVGSVATVVGAQVASAALTVGPFYQPLLSDGFDAFMRSLPVTDEARQAIYADVESPFSFHALAVFTAYRYVREDFVPRPVRKAASGIMDTVRRALSVRTGSDVAESPGPEGRAIPAGDGQGPPENADLDRVPTGYRPG